MPAKPISFCGISADVVGDVAVGDLRLEVAALEAEDDRLVDGAVWAQWWSGSAGGDRAASRAGAVGLHRAAPAAALRARGGSRPGPSARAGRATARCAYGNVDDHVVIVPATTWSSSATKGDPSPRLDFPASIGCTFMSQVRSPVLPCQSHDIADDSSPGLSLEGQ